MNPWQWVRDNSVALQGAAAIVVIMGAAVTVPAYLWRFYKPDVLVRVASKDRIAVPARPPIRWRMEMLDAVRSLPRTTPTLEKRFLDLAAQAELMKFHEHASASYTSIEVLNQSERLISGIRLRFKTLIGWPTLSVSGTFLPEAERQHYVQQVEAMKLGSNLNVLLPELPPLPPGAVFTLEMFDAGFLEFDVSAPGASWRMVRVVDA